MIDFIDDAAKSLQLFGQRLESLRSRQSTTRTNPTRSNPTRSACWRRRQFRRKWQNEQQLPLRSRLFR
jgi:hypothetical protein